MYRRDITKYDSNFHNHKLNYVDFLSFLNCQTKQEITDKTNINITRTWYYTVRIELDKSILINNESKNLMVVRYKYKEESTHITEIYCYCLNGTYMIHPLELKEIMTKEGFEFILKLYEDDINEYLELTQNSINKKEKELLELNSELTYFKNLTNI